MAPRANWKGFLRLSLVTCPVALYPATSDSEKISFNQINRNTGHRIKYLKVDADTGEEVSNDDIMKGYKVDTDTYIEVSKDELENIALESTRTIDINEFVPKQDIDPRYLCVFASFHRARRLPVCPNRETLWGLGRHAPKAPERCCRFPSKSRYST
jgi:DNA end-binding protein Ku